MNDNMIKNDGSIFDDIRKIDDTGNDYWLARELSKALEYSDFRNFTNAIDKSKQACVNKMCQTISLMSTRWFR